MAILVPGNLPRAGSIMLDGRPSRVGMSKDTRGWIERARASLNRPCPGCSVDPIDLVRVSILMSCAWCRCSACVTVDMNSEATRVETQSEKNAAAVRAVAFKKITADIKAKMGRGR